MRVQLYIPKDWRRIYLEGKMEKNFIDEFIPSKDTRAYLHSMTNAELCKNRAEIKNKGEDDYGNSVQGNQAIFGKKH